MITINYIEYEQGLREKAESLARQLQLCITEDGVDECLLLTSAGLHLKIPGFNLLSADFSLAAWNKRLMQGKKQPLVRACKASLGIKILDATAGFGRDAAVLASFGAEVMMLERNPIMAALLQDALDRRSSTDKQQMNLSLLQTNAQAYLAQLNEEQFPDIIYMDPMHPARTKSALVKKEMQVLHHLIGSDEDATELLISAIKHAKLRVVVKWPQKAKPLMPTTRYIAGKTIRYDIYP